MKEQISSIEELSLFAKKFLVWVKEREVKGSGALVVGLYGDLGSGKTAFVKQVAEHLGITNTVTSPTFVIEKIYKLPEGSLLEDDILHIIHIDAYRLESGDELTMLGWEQITSDPHNIIFIEWPERVKDILPKDIKKISFTFVDENTRDIEW